MSHTCSICGVVLCVLPRGQDPLLSLALDDASSANATAMPVTSSKQILECWCHTGSGPPTWGPASKLRRMMNIAPMRIGPCVPLKEINDGTCNRLSPAAAVEEAR